jgi:hypothetical protein
MSVLIISRIHFPCYLHNPMRLNFDITAALFLKFSHGRKLTHSKRALGMCKPFVLLPSYEGDATVAFVVRLNDET